MEDGPRPFKAFLDVGLKRTSTGARVFGAMKGASDGGIFVPHSENRFPGYDPEAKELDAETLQKYIYGGTFLVFSPFLSKRGRELIIFFFFLILVLLGHVAEFMESLEEEDDERFKKHFSTYLADDIGSEDLEDLYKAAHEAIRADPVAQLTDKAELEEWKAASKKTHPKKLSLEQRRERIAEKKAKWTASRGQVEEEDEE